MKSKLFIPQIVAIGFLLLNLIACGSQDRASSEDEDSNFPLTSFASASLTASIESTDQLFMDLFAETPIIGPRIASTIFPRQTRTPVPLPAATAILSLAQLNPNCSTPMSLMLHSAFGTQRMDELAQEIIARGLRTITYRNVLESLYQGECPDENAIIVSLDDLGTNWLRPDFRRMIKVFTDLGLVLTVGVVVQGPQNNIIWNYLRELDSMGIEIASHSVNHYQLSALSLESLDEEISASFQIICENLGRCPISLILPFGDGGNDERVFVVANEYVFVVGIGGGLAFAGTPPYYVGRIPPDNNSQSVTITLLENTFGR